jgi:hypothetical protein
MKDKQQKNFKTLVAYAISMTVFVIVTVFMLYKVETEDARAIKNLARYTTVYAKEISVLRGLSNTSGDSIFHAPNGKTDKQVLAENDQRLLKNK